jgi:hypothetical protein
LTPTKLPCTELSHRAVARSYIRKRIHEFNRRKIAFEAIAACWRLRMFRPKTSTPAKKVWRISKNAPMGEWVNKSAPIAPKPNKDLPEVSHGPWVRSSYDLLDGADVTEGPDTLPDDLFDELFAPEHDAPKKTGE